MARPHPRAARAIHFSPTPITPNFLRAMSLSFLPNNAFPLPAPLTSELVALGLDEKSAGSLSKVYISSALTLKRTYETEYDRACNAFISTSDSRGYNSKELRSRLLTVINGWYTQALSKWVEEAIREANSYLLGRKKKHVPQPKVCSWVQILSHRCKPFYR